MPQPSSSSSSQAQQGNKSRKPAHQNTFAFRHNPNSKKTAIILSSPNVHVCRRCHEKIEWRKQYRKYKPLTQPSKCNHCDKRNVLAAYHTICTKCSTSSSKSRALLDEWNDSSNKCQQDKSHKNDEDGGSEDHHHQQQQHPEVTDGSEKNDNDETTALVRVVHPHRRVCCMCVKEPALPCADDEDNDDANTSSRFYAADGRKLKLREVKALQRKPLQAKRSSSKKNKTTQQQHQQQEEEDSENDKNGEDHDDVSDDRNAETTVPSKGSGHDFTDDDDDDDNDEDDPFLRAVGGADKLLTGEAYQQMLLQKAASNM